MDEDIKKVVSDKFDETKAMVDSASKLAATKIELEDLKKTVETQSVEMADALEKAKAPKVEGFDEKFLDFLVENKTKLDEIRTKGSGVIEFNYDFLADKSIEKVVGGINTDSGGDAAPAPVNHNTMLNRIRLRDDNSLVNLCTTISTNSASFPYTETSPKEGGYDFVAEGVAKPQIDFQWINRYAEPFKIAAYEVMSDEVVRDIPRLMSTARGFLKDKHDLFKADAIYFSDGAAGKPLGATVIARTFAAGGMALKVVNPDIMDAINAIVTDVYTTQNYADETPFMPNLVLLNPIDFFLYLKAARDSGGKRTYDGVNLFDSYQKDGLTIRPWHKVPEGKIFVGDMSKYNISNWVRYSVKIGWINDQFITNEFTLLGESRSHYFVKNFDQMGFVYDDIATVLTAITAP